MMLDSIDTVLHEIETLQRKAIAMPKTRDDKSWLHDIPSEPGWYWIKTNAKTGMLIEINYKQVNHTDISKTIIKTSGLQELGLAITQSESENYIVYNGEAANLKSRAREHFQGHPKTYSLGISDHENLLVYNWVFCYVPVLGCKTIPNKYTNNKLLRVAVEQAWRSKHGWPILCIR